MEIIQTMDTNAVYNETDGTTAADSGTDRW